MSRRATPPKRTPEKKPDSQTVDTRVAKSKEEMLANLTKLPIVQVSCERTGIARATYYKWRKEDSGFSRLADRAIEAGALHINDLAESKLIKRVNEENMTAIIYWLKNRHPSYSDKMLHYHEHHSARKFTREEVTEVAKAFANIGLANSVDMNEIIPPEDRESEEDGDEDGGSSRVVRLRR